jgi:hypothetical protein
MLMSTRGVGPGTAWASGSLLLEGHIGHPGVCGVRVHVESSGTTALTVPLLSPLARSFHPSHPQLPLHTLGKPDILDSGSLDNN